MIQRNKADIPEMLTEPGKWLDGDALLFKGTSETQHEVLTALARRRVVESLSRPQT
jgi:hypothetical protein